MHKNRTASGLIRQAKLDQSYKKRLIGKFDKKGRKIVDVVWVGNSVYGCVKIIYDNKEEQIVGSVNGFKPNNDDFIINGIILK